MFVKYHDEAGNIRYSYIFSSRFLSNRRAFDLLPKGRPEKKDGGECFAPCHGKGGRHWGCPRACHQEPGILREWIYALCLTLESLVHPFLSRVSSKAPSKYFFSYVLNFRNLHIFVKYHGEEGNIKYSYIFSSRFLSNRRTFDLLPKGHPEKKDGGECFAPYHGKGGRHWG